MQSLTRLIEQFAKRPFFRNFGIAATGTASAQLVSVAFAPILTRLYGPEAYGIQGLFMAIATLFLAVAALGYHTSIAIPKTNSVAFGLAKIAIYAGCLTSGLTAIALFLINDGVLAVLNIQIISNYKYLIPVAMAAWVLNAVLMQCLIREKSYVYVAKFMVITALLVCICKLILGWVQPTALALIASNMLGTMIGTAVMYAFWRDKESILRAYRTDNEPHPKLIQLAKDYADFAVFRTPSKLLNAFATSLPVFLFTSYFGSAVAGHYVLAASVLGLPIYLIGAAVMDVFYPRINTAIQHHQNVSQLVIKATLMMLLSGAAPYLVIAIFGPIIFESAFGEGWRQAGVYAQWLSLLFYVQYIGKPVFAAIPALRLQVGLLAFEFIVALAKLFALWYGHENYKNEVVSIGLFVGVGVIGHVVLIAWVIKESQTPHVRNPA
jgi:O-antigen/teichoic acid export membrane protein